MKTNVLLVVVAAVALVAGDAVAARQAAGAGQAAPEANVGSTGDAAHGKQLFEKKNCYYCHGTAGQGGRDGARIAATAMNARAFIRYVRQPAGAMPAYTEKILSEQELTDIHAYLKSLPAAKAPSEIPLLAQLREK